MMTTVEMVEHLRTEISVLETNMTGASLVGDKPAYQRLETKRDYLQGLLKQYEEAAVA